MIARPPDDADYERHERDLLELTSLPTAAGREQRVIAWVRAWADRRPHLDVSEDEHGNLLLRPRDARGENPIIFTGHLDHPAFVVTDADGKTAEAEFRGGVYLPFFQGTGVRLWQDGSDRPIATGTVTDAREAGAGGFKTATLAFDAATQAEPGDVVTWNLEPSRIDENRLLAPVCDDLAAVAAALAALDELTQHLLAPEGSDVRVLLTRAEEVGFVGAIGACTSGIIPPNARLIALENSKSFAESPLGGGPIVRVGDATSTFDPALTYAVGQVARRLAGEDNTFKWQRKLMPGGTLRGLRVPGPSATPPPASASPWATTTT